MHGLTARLCALLIVLFCLPTAWAEHALTLYGDPPKYPADFSHFDYVNPDAPKGGTLRLAGLNGFDSLNPFIPKGNAVDEIGLIYDRLTYHSADEPFTEYGLLAERIERDPDNHFVRFHLRPEARFHDGQPVTSADVAHTFELLTTKGHPLYRHYYADVSEVVEESEHSVRFDFKHNNNRELPLILGQLQILPKHYWQEQDFEKTSLQPPLGSGPYKISRVSAGRSITYERVENWWGKDLPVNRGQYNFDRVQIDYYQDMSVALEAFKAGQFDFNLEYSAKDWATGYASPALKRGDIIREEVRNHNPVGMQAYVFNLRRPMFQDRRVREAIGLLFDYEWTNKQLFYGAYLRSNSFFANSELAASGLPSAAELELLEPLRGQIPDEVFSSEFKLPISDASGIIRERRLQAWKLLEQAGYRIEKDRMVNADGQPLAFEFIIAQANLERVLLPFKRNLSELGIEMTIRRADVSQYINRMRSRDFDMTSAIWPQSNSPGNEQRDFWHSDSFDNPGSRNFIGLQNPAVDQLVEGLINADSRDSLIAHTRALDRVLLWGHYVIPNYYTDSWRIAHWKHLQRPAKAPLYDYGIFTWWIDETQPQALEAAE